MPSTLRRALFLAGCLLPAPALAHDLWIEHQGPLHTLLHGHEHAGHAGQQRLEYRPETVRQALCFGPDGAVRRAERGAGYPASLKGSCAAAWFLVSSGYWSKTPHGTKNLPRTEAGAVLASWLSWESAKRITAWGEAFAQPLTRELELVPLANPLRLAPGDKLRLRAYYQGRPAAGVAVAYRGRPRGGTGADGGINIRLAEPGLQLIQASLEAPIDDPGAERAIHATTLQFDPGADPP